MPVTALWLTWHATRVGYLFWGAIRSMTSLLYNAQPVVDQTRLPSGPFPCASPAREITGICSPFLIDRGAPALVRFLV